MFFHRLRPSVQLCPITPGRHRKPEERNTITAANGTWIYKHEINFRSLSPNTQLIPVWSSEGKKIKKKSSTLSWQSPDHLKQEQWNTERSLGSAWRTWSLQCSNCTCRGSRGSKFRPSCRMRKEGSRRKDTRVIHGSCLISADTAKQT